MENSDNSKKYKFYRKPSFRKEGPKVKQTKTSLRRLQIANPLLQVENEGLLDLDLKDPKLSRQNSIISDRKTKLTPQITDSIAPTTNRQTLASKKPAAELIKETKKKSCNPPKPRRSLSAEHFDRKKGMKKVVNEPCSKGSSQSYENVSEPVKFFPGSAVSPIAEVSYENAFVFKTPSAIRRSRCLFTPHSANSTRRSLLYHPTTPLPTLNDLQKRLNEWLTRRGKSITLFHHLKIFHPVEEENKENIEVDQDLDRGSYEDLRIDNASEKNGDKWESVAKAALVELNNLIQEGYSIEQCEEWLKLIKDKYSKIQEGPEYWECRAAIEQSRGNITNAVDCYRTAIIQGAEVRMVDRSLDVLLQKFSLLNINTENSNEKSVTDRERARIVQDARNVFKSSIIKFAIQEKKSKKNDNEVKLIATPVRRSTRFTRSPVHSTPGIKFCTSLQELDSPERKKIEFIENKALV